MRKCEKTHTTTPICLISVGNHLELQVVITIHYQVDCSITKMWPIQSPFVWCKLGSRTFEYMKNGVIR